MKPMKCTLTWYSGRDDRYGNETARRNLQGRFEAIQGSSVAVDPKLIPYGSLLVIPALTDFSLFKDGVYFAHDTGSAVIAKVASKARGNDYPVIDVYADVDEAGIAKLAEKYGELVEFWIRGDEPKWPYE